jgi:hypothetical protein
MKSIISSIVMLCMSGLAFAEEAPVVRECEKEEVVCEKMSRKIHKQPVKKIKCKVKEK